MNEKGSLTDDEYELKRKQALAPGHRVDPVVISSRVPQRSAS